MVILKEKTEKREMFEYMIHKKRYEKCKRRVSWFFLNLKQFIVDDKYQCVKYYSKYDTGKTLVRNILITNVEFIIN